MDDPKCDAVTWTADGRAFVVHDRAVFERKHLIGLLADSPHTCTFVSFVRSSSVRVSEPSVSTSAKRLMFTSVIESS